MKILICLLLCFAFLFLVGTLMLAFSPYWYYAIPCFFFGTFACIAIVFIVFSKHVNKYYRRNFNVLFCQDIITALLAKDKLVFENTCGIWMCQDFNTIKLDLFGCVCPKAFIESWIIRLSRYNDSTDRLPVSSIIKHSRRVKKINNLQIIFVDKNITRSRSLIRNKQSKYNFVSQLTAMAPYYRHYIGNIALAALDRITVKNEKDFLLPLIKR